MANRKSKVIELRPNTSISLRPTNKKIHNKRVYEISNYNNHNNPIKNQVTDSSEVEEYQKNQQLCKIQTIEKEKTQKLISVVLND